MSKIPGSRGTISKGLAVVQWQAGDDGQVEQGQSAQRPISGMHWSLSIIWISTVVRTNLLNDCLGEWACNILSWVPEGLDGCTADASEWQQSREVLVFRLFRSRCCSHHLLPAHCSGNVKYLSLPSWGWLVAGGDW